MREALIEIPGDDRRIELLANRWKTHRHVELAQASVFHSFRVAQRIGCLFLNQPLREDRHQGDRGHRRQSFREHTVRPRERRPELALLDIGLPVMDGYELGRRLRAGVKISGCQPRRYSSPMVAFWVHWMWVAPPR